MPDDYRISDLSTAPSIGNSDLMELSVVNTASETGYTSMKAPVLNLANKIVNATQYVSDLQTQNKTITGAINEIAQGGGGGGGDADIVKTASGNPCSFSTSFAGALKSLKCEINASGGNGSPDNPIPLVGHSELNLTRCGVNLIDVSEPIVINTGVTSDRLVTTFEVVAGVTYTLSCMQENSMTSNERNTLLVVINGNRTYESSSSNYHLSSGIHTLTFTPSVSGECEIRIWGHTLIPRLKEMHFHLN